jgi:hypothetical protein
LGAGFYRDGGVGGADFQYHVMIYIQYPSKASRYTLSTEFAEKTGLYSSRRVKRFNQDFFFQQPECLERKGN